MLGGRNHTLRVSCVVQLAGSQQSDNRDSWYSSRRHGSVLSFRLTSTGCPPAWTPPIKDIKLREDKGNYRRDPNVASLVQSRQRKPKILQEEENPTPVHAHRSEPCMFSSMGLKILNSLDSKLRRCAIPCLYFVQLYQVRQSNARSIRHAILSRVVGCFQELSKS